MRKQRADERFKEKLDQRQKLIDKQIEILSNLKNREEEILAKQIKEAEEKKNEELAEKKRRRGKLQEQIDLSRKL